MRDHYARVNLADRRDSLDLHALQRVVLQFPELERILDGGVQAPASATPRSWSSS
jgi:hypothetical protein